MPRIRSAPKLLVDVLRRFTRKLGGERALVELEAYLNNDPSQYGEGRIIAQILEIEARRGKALPKTYLEIGSSHPYFLSTSWYLEKQASLKGVCVEPQHKFQDLFMELRPQTILVSAAAIPTSYKEDFITVYQCDTDVLTTIDKAEALNLVKLGYNVRQAEVKAISINSLISQAIFKNGLGVLLIDIESHELQKEILQECIQSKTTPRLICVETLEFMGSSKDFRVEYLEILAPAGYQEVASTYLNTIYIRS